MANVLERQAARYLKGHNAKQFILGSSTDELKTLFSKATTEKYRFQQAIDGVMHGAREMDDLRLLPKQVRHDLTGLGVNVGRSTVDKVVSSSDGTMKIVTKLFDGLMIETAAIPTEDRLTVCVSSQVGCAMKCSFCATGKGGYARNLMPHEILDQVLSVRDLFKEKPVTNVVFMGMGEPALNIPSVLKSVNLLIDSSWFGLSQRNITISTVGIPNTMSLFAKEVPQITLAISLHAPSQALREELVPSAKAYPLDKLLSDVSDYFAQTKRRITFEYVLLSAVNDSVEHAHELVKLLKSHCRYPFHVNLLPWNPVDDAAFVRPDPENVKLFQRVLQNANVETTVRTTRGRDANAACGQLRNENQKRSEIKQ